MSRFRKGDRVINLKEDDYVNLHATGTVDEDDSTCPWVIWYEGKPCTGRRTPINEDKLQLLSEWEAKQKKEPDWSVFSDSDMHLSPFQKIDKLEAENARLRAELEELKPKPKTWEGWVYVYRDKITDEIQSDCYLSGNKNIISYNQIILAQKRFTITEGEGL